MMASMHAKIRLELFPAVWPTPCEQCGATIPMRPGRQPRYCSTSCRVRAHRGQSGPAESDRQGYAWKYGAHGDDDRYRSRDR